MTQGKQEKTELSHHDLLRVLARALPELLRSAPLLVGSMFLMAVVQGVIPAVTILLGKWTVDSITQVAQGQPIQAGTLNVTVLAWAGTALLGQVTQVGAQVLQGYVSDHFTVRVMRELMRKVESLPGLDVMEDPQFHDDVEVLSQGASHRPLNLVSTLLYTLRALVAALSVALTLLVVGWWVPFVIVASLLPALLQQMQFYKLGWSMFIQQTPQARELNYTQRLALRHEFAKEVRLYHLFPVLHERYLTGVTAYQRSIRSVRNKQLLGVLPLQSLALVATAGLFVYVTWQAAQGQLSAGSVVLVIGALAGLRDELTVVSEYLSMGTEHLRWFGKYHAFLDAVPGVAHPKQPKALPRTLDLTLQDVSFAYRGLPPVLEGLDLHIPEGQVVALVGENGAGKTTLVKLLLRFYDPTSGQILVGSGAEQLDLREVDIQAWRKQVAAVFQDFARFEWTLRQNIVLGDVQDEQKLARAVAGSGLESTLPRITGGLDARIGQAFGGIDLSGGQWQKLVTARALYRDARILILDEPTAALDPRSEREVFDAFAALARGRTTMLITHRLGSVLMADRILVMKGGQLIEDGTHADLLALGGEYAELWALQASQYGETPDGAQSR